MSSGLSKDATVEQFSSLEMDSSEVSGRFFYGWVMVPISMATLIASSPGQTFGVSILNEPMRTSLSLSHGELAAAYTLGTLCGAIPITLTGTLMDRFGLRKVLLATLTLFSLACFVISTVQGWISLFLAFFLLRSLGPGALAFLSGNTLAFWFERRLGMVEGFRSMGMAIAMAFIPATNLWLVSQYGWRGAYIALGAAVWLVMFPLVWFFFRERPKKSGRSSTVLPQSPTIIPVGLVNRH